MPARPTSTFSPSATAEYTTVVIAICSQNELSTAGIANRAAASKINNVTTRGTVIADHIDGKRVPRSSPVADAAR